MSHIVAVYQEAGEWVWDCWCQLGAERRVSSRPRAWRDAFHVHNREHGVWFSDLIEAGWLKRMVTINHAGELEAWRIENPGSDRSMSTYYGQDSTRELLMKVYGPNEHAWWKED